MTRRIVKILQHYGPKEAVQKARQAGRCSLGVVRWVLGLFPCKITVPLPGGLESDSSGSNGGRWMGWAGNAGRPQAAEDLAGSKPVPL